MTVRDVLRSLMVQEVASGKALREKAVAAEYYAASLAGSPYASAAEEIAVKNWLAVGDFREAALALAEFREQGTDVLGRSEEAIRVYDDLLARFGDRREPALAEPVARALVSTGVTLGGLDQSAEAIRVYDDYWRGSATGGSLRWPNK